MSERDVVIAGAVRTPIGSFQGTLSSLSAPQLGAVAVREAVHRAGVAPDGVDRIFMGNVLPAAAGQAPARQAALGAGLPNSVAAVTVNKVCGSGLQAVMFARREILLDDASVVVAGGMESMSNAPYALPKARSGLRMGDAPLIDTMVHDGLWDPYNNVHMGNCGDLVADHYGFTREDQDAFALESYRRAMAAQSEGRFKDEIVPVEIPNRRGEPVVVEEDEEPKRARLDSFGGLRAAFSKTGTVTAANASSINDGAAALVVCEGPIARERGLPVMARILGDATFAQDPQWFTTAPVHAMARLFEKTGLGAQEWDLFEINEAFSGVTMAAVREHDLDAARVNVNGGAVSLGHPIGCSGARILVTLLHALRDRGLRRGVATLCIGGGEAVALGIELAG